MNLSEAELVERAKRGQRDAFVELLAQSGPVVRPVVIAMISPGLQALLTADDVMQQAYTDAYLGLQQFKYEGPGSFDRWLTTLAKRNCVDGVRALQATKRGGDRDRIQTREESMVSLLDVLTGVSATPSYYAAGQEAHTALTAAIDQLPAIYGHVVRRLDLDGAGISAVTGELSRTAGAIYMLRARAHDRLREIMGSSSRFLSGGA